jgi:hypothetical protein
MTATNGELHPYFLTLSLLFSRFSTRFAFYPRMRLLLLRQNRDFFILRFLSKYQSFSLPAPNNCDKLGASVISLNHQTATNMEGWKNSLQAPPHPSPEGEGEIIYSVFFLLCLCVLLENA